MTEVLNTETGELTETDEDAIAAEMSPDTDEPNEEDEPELTERGDEQVRQDRATDDREIEKAMQSLAKEAERHKNRIREIMGEDADGLTPCELCLQITPGFRWDRSPDEPTIAAVRVAIGMPDLTNYRASATEHTCDDCGGLGKVRTGSTVAKFETADCDACGGKGFVPTRPRENTSPLDTPQAATTNEGPPVYDDGVKRDMFGTPETDPDYNLMPGARARPTDYWQTNRE